MNVLIFPGGTETGLEIRNSLMYRWDINLFSAGSPGSSHAHFAYKVHDSVPDISEPNWFDALHSTIVNRGIDYVYPTLDDVLLELSGIRDKLPAILITHPHDTVCIARSKRKTFEALSGVVRTPKLLEPTSIDEYPVFVKPDCGAGSRGARVVSSQLELSCILQMEENMLIMEYAPYDEYTVDCFSDRDEGLLYVGPRIRSRIKRGISMDSQSVFNTELTEMARSISENIEFHGAWFFQARRAVDGGMVLLEIGSRIGGTMAVSRARGVNLALLSLYEAQRKPLNISIGNYSAQIDRALLNRYKLGIEYDTVYVDLDDTLIINRKINTLLIRFLYQCINKGKRVVVITRNTTPYTVLRKYRLLQVIDAVIRVGLEESKCSVIVNDKERGLSSKPIFIDDSFEERLDVQRSLDIPVFDNCMVETLIEEKV